MNLVRSTFLAIALAMSSGSAVLAQDYITGMAAYEDGDYATAMREFRPLAEQGDVDAQANLGYMYQKGYGVPQDSSEAVKWYRLAAEQGHLNAQAMIGLMYAFGDAVLQSNVMAHMWYNIASANGSEMTGEWRDEIAGSMTNSEISTAQAKASECMSSGYRNCGW